LLGRDAVRFSEDGVEEEKNGLSSDDEGMQAGLGCLNAQNSHIRAKPMLDVKCR
jgi:hypothetical protein